MTDTTTSFDQEVDLLVMGSGAGGMTAALRAKDRGLDVVIAEKSRHYGGSSAMSGGGIWAPNSPTMLAAGQADPPESVRAYLDAVVGDDVTGERKQAYVEQAPAMMAFLERAGLPFFWVKGYADYHPDAPGGRPLGRSQEALPIDLRELGDDLDALQPSQIQQPGPFWITAADANRANMVGRTWTGRLQVLKIAWRVITGLIRRTKTATMGLALIARLRIALRNAGVPLWLASPVTKLITDDEGAVIGAEVERDGRTVRVRTRRGVLVASGGFDRNVEMRNRYQPLAEGGRWAMGSPELTGDGHRIGEQVGAALDLMDDAWWMPGFVMPDGRNFTLVADRSVPRAFIVNGAGRRFTNEASPYVNFVHDQLDGHETGVSHIPAYLVIDATARKRYLTGGLLPYMPIPKEWYASGLAHRADSIEQLAEKIGVPPQNLRETTDRFNAFARQARDEDYGRGDNAYDRYYGDPTLPNPALDVVEDAPFHAFQVVPGDLGTKGGLLTDERARVLREDGSVIDGLYATGNASASVMGHDYPGAGGTLGPSMTFGYVAADTAADRDTGSDA